MLRANYKHCCACCFRKTIMLAPDGKQHRTMIMRVYVKWRLIFIIGLVVLLVAFSYKGICRFYFKKFR